MKTEVSNIIQAAPDDVWLTLSQGGDVHRWFSGVITTCDLVGAGEGATRTCTMADGSKLEERIIEIDHANKLFRYAIDTHPLPATDLVATIQLRGLPEGRSQITWGADYEVADADAHLVHEALTRIYSQGILALESHHQTIAQEAI